MNLHYSLFFFSFLWFLYQFVIYFIHMANCLKCEIMARLHFIYHITMLHHDWKQRTHRTHIQMKLQCECKQCVIQYLWEDDMRYKNKECGGSNACHNNNNNHNDAGISASNNDDNYANINHTNHMPQNNNGFEQSSSDLFSISYNEHKRRHSTMSHRIVINKPKFHLTLTIWIWTAKAAFLNEIILPHTHNQLNGNKWDAGSICFSYQNDRIFSSFYL